MHAAMTLVVTLWAANMVAAKYAFRGFSAPAVAQLRVLGAAAIYGIVFLMRSPRPSLRLTRREWIFYGVTALSGVTLNQLFFIGGLARSSVAHTGLIVALGPVMVLALAWMMGLEAMTALKLTGIVISFAGVAVLTVVSRHDAGGGSWVGNLILVAGTAVFSYYTILMKEAADRLDELTLSLLTFGFGALLMLPFAGYAVWKVRWSAIPAAAYGGLAFMIVLGTVIPYLLFAYSMTGLFASRVAAFNYLQPVIATGLAIWLLSEKLTLGTVAGGALILLGVYLTEREHGEKPASGDKRELRLWA
jgi:drug/metabolite transporter (DMT)-like permease